MSLAVAISEGEVAMDHSLDASDILTPDAIRFVTRLEKEFGDRRKELLRLRAERQQELNRGIHPDFLIQSRWVREENWKVRDIPNDLQKRTVEITGPVERKMMINALNSGADVFMADFEDATSPTWRNLIEGHRNLRDTVSRTISLETPEGKNYRLNEHTAVLFVRPRGWHLPEKHFLLEGNPISASLFDAGLYFFHNAHALLNSGTGPYFYLPKLEDHLEARLWNDVFQMMQDDFGIPRGTIKATVLLETILAAFQMEEILYELKDHIVGLNAGRWDYIFSIIKKFQAHQEVLLPDRASITMTVPFMRAYTQLLVQTCHRRGAHAIGGMAAFIPSRKDVAINERALAKVREDKEREAADGFDGTWVAHPDLVSVAREPFARVLGDRPHQKEQVRQDVNVSAGDLLNFRIPEASITEEGLRNNINVAIQYIESWLQGVGAVGIFNLMEDAATAEISRSQLWQWVHHPDAMLSDGRKINHALFGGMLQEELERIKNDIGANRFQNGRYADACKIFNELVTSPHFEDFLTLIAYDRLD